MIFYTVQGLNYKLEIYTDKIKLIKRPWLVFFTKTPWVQSWDIDQLETFQVTTPKVFFSGKLKWQTFNGDGITFRFTTTAPMVSKIELYFQKRIAKNLLKKADVLEFKSKKKSHKEKRLAA